MSESTPASAAVPSTTELPSGDPVPPPEPAAAAAEAVVAAETAAAETAAEPVTTAVAEPPASAPSEPTTTTTTTTAATTPAVPAPAAPAPAPAAAKKPTALQALLNVPIPSGPDAFMAHLQRCLSTPSGMDVCLLFVCYTSRLAAALLETAVAGPLLQKSAKRLVALAAALPPSATVIFNSAATARIGGMSAVAAQAALVLAGRLKNLGSLMSEARTITRLWGMLGVYFWAKGLLVKLQQTRKAAAEGKVMTRDEKLDSAIAWSQMLSIAWYQALENVAYLSSRGVLGWSPQAQGSMAKWATRGWGAYVGLEIGRLLYEGRKREAAQKEKLAAAASSSEKSVAVMTAEEEKEDDEWTEAWRIGLIRNMSWFPLTIHWSMDQGYVNDLTVGALGTIPGIVQMAQLWRNTA